MKNLFLSPAKAHLKLSSSFFPQAFKIALMCFSVLHSSWFTDNKSIYLTSLAIQITFHSLKKYCACIHSAFVLIFLLLQ